MYDATVRAVNKLVYCKTFCFLVVEEPHPDYLTLPPGLRFVKMDEESLLACAGSKEYELRTSFVHEAVARGDECFAVLDGAEIASYGWYSLRPTIIQHNLRVRISPRYVYRYKAFTPRKYRGLRLHAVGMTLALSHYRSLGFKGFICCVESNNFSSLKSCYRTGYTHCSEIRVARFAGRHLIRHAGSYEQYGLLVTAD
jgi:hypothetical protein